jgi:hypothetical protein
MAVSGNTASIAIPTAVPANWTDTASCTAANSAGKASGSAAITLQYQKPAITSVAIAGSNTLVPYFGAYGCVYQPITINGSGFYAGGTVTVTYPNSTSQKPLSLTTFSQLTLNQIQFIVPCEWDPDWIEYSYASPATGNGGGTSNVATMLFPGNLNTVTLTPTDVVEADQGSYTVWSFKTSNLSLDTSEVISDQGLAYDNGANTLVVGDFGNSGGPGNFVLAIPSNVGAAVNSNPMGVAAGDGLALFAEPIDNTLGAFAVSTTNISTPSYVTIPGVPWNVEQTTLNGTSTGVVLSVETDVLTLVSVFPTNPITFQVGQSIPLPNLTPQSKLPALCGGWDLAVADTTAWVLSNCDASVTLVDLSTGAFVKQVAIPGYPYRAAINPADDSVVVALANLTNAQTTFVRIDNSQGNVTPTPLAATFPIPCIGFKISPDGTTLYCGAEGQVLAAKNK